MNIFRIFIIQRQIKTGKANVSDIVLDEVLDFLKGYLWILFFIFLPILLLTGFFGLTSFVNGPYGVAKFFFYFFLIIFLIVFSISYLIYSRFKKWILIQKKKHF